MGFPTITLNPAQCPGNLTGGNEANVSEQLLEKVRADTAPVLKALASQLNGLSQTEAEARVKQIGLNEIAREKRQSVLLRLTLIIHVIRTNKIPFIQSRASWPLIITSSIIVAVGAWLTVSPLAGTLGFVPLPPLYWLLLAIILLGYVILTQMVKTWFFHKIW